MARLLQNGAVTFIGDGQQEWSLSVTENISHAIALSATHPAAANQAFNVADAKVKIADTIRVIAEALHLPFPNKRSGVVSAAFRSLLNQSEANPARMNIDLFFPLWRGVTINAEKIRRDLGWEPHIPWQDSVREGALEWKQAQTPAR